jgi:gentisate 1,2-dioxygenase
MATLTLTEERRQYYAELERMQMGALWNVYRSTLTREPQRRETPFLWPWEAVRPQLLRAGELVTAAEAERRVLMFVNPGSPNRISATATLYAAMQLILPGESARAHRHSQAALRFVVEGQGAFTCVNGERIPMSPGDLVLTPPMVWHDHGNDGTAPVIWLDGLDIPLTQSLNCGFFEEFSSDVQPLSAPAFHSEKLYGRALLPAIGGGGPSQTTSQTYSPLSAYRWADAREALTLLAHAGEPDSCDGFMLRYANPANGGEVLATLGCRLQLLPRGMNTQARRRSTSSIIHFAEGSGHTVIDGVRFDWKKSDTLAVPVWSWVEHAVPAEDAVLFSFTDEPVIRALGHFQEQMHS